MEWVADGGLDLYWLRSMPVEKRHLLVLRAVMSSDTCRVGRGDESSVLSSWLTESTDVQFEPPKQLTDKDEDHSDTPAHLPPMWDRPRIANVGF